MIIRFRIVKCHCFHLPAFTHCAGQRFGSAGADDKGAAKCAT